MIKKNLSGVQQTIVLEGLERPQFLAFQYIGRNTEIKAEIQRVGKDTVKLISKTSIAVLHEAQQKIKRLVDNTPIVPIVFNNDESFIEGVIIQLSIGGEIGFDDVNDKIVVTLTNMDNKGGSCYVIGASSTTKNYYRFVDQFYDGKSDEMRMDVNDFDFLVFRTAEYFPELIEKFYENDVDRENEPQIKFKESLVHGVVGYNINAVVDGIVYEPQFGSFKSIVIDVRGLQILTLKDERGNDYSFHAVKLS